MTQIKFVFGLLALIGFLFTGCENTGEIFKPFSGKDKGFQSTRKSSDAVPLLEGAVYTMTNDAFENKIVVFHRSSSGYLDYLESYPTKGRGTGTNAIDPLASQGSIVISDGHIHTDHAIKVQKAAPKSTGRLLWAVNAGSNSISVFAITDAGLDLLDVIGSGGELPVSITVHNDLLYVLNKSGGERSIESGPSSNITGFRIRKGGQLSAIAGSVRPLSGPVTGAAQVQFSPDGRFLVVTEKETNAVDIYIVQEDGTTQGPFVNESAGITPFGFDFDSKGRLVVAEAFGNMAYQSAVTSYELGFKLGAMQTVDPSVRTGQSGGSRLVINPYGNFAYVANTHSGTISTLRVMDSGELVLITEDNEVAKSDNSKHPIDLALSQDGRFLYALDSAIGTVYAFKVGEEGRPVPLKERMQVQPGFPGSQGLAAY